MTSDQIAKGIIADIETGFNFNLGGQKISFFKMVGATAGERKISYDENSLMFKVSTPKHNGKIVIRLNEMDTYDIEFWTIKNFEAKKINEVNDVYNDQLTDILVKELGV